MEGEEEEEEKKKKKKKSSNVKNMAENVNIFSSMNVRHI